MNVRDPYAVAVCKPGHEITDQCPPFQTSVSIYYISGVYLPFITCHKLFVVHCMNETVTNQTTKKHFSATN